MKKILFLHGLNSRPGGKKPTFLKGKGFKVFNPSLPKSSFEESMAIAQQIIDDEKPDAIVGSSRGGAVAMCLNTSATECGIVLVAPAWTRFDRSQCEDVNLSSSSMIIHSRHDNIVSISDSENLASTSGAKLICVGNDHRMSDNDALEAILDAVMWVTR